MNDDHAEAPIKWIQFIKFCNNFKSQFLDVYSDLFGKIIRRYNHQLKDINDWRVFVSSLVVDIETPSTQVITFFVVLGQYVNG